MHYLEHMLHALHCTLSLSPNLQEKGCAVTALIHFMTSINTAQVVVAGGGGGGLTWYISQPPQKTFSVLFTDSQHSPAAVVSLQVGWLLIVIPRAKTMMSSNKQYDAKFCL